MYHLIFFSWDAKILRTTRSTSYLLKVSVEAERHHGVLVNLYGVLGWCLVERMRGEPYVTFRQGGAVWLGRAGRVACGRGIRPAVAGRACLAYVSNLHLQPLDLMHIICTDETLCGAGAA